MNAPGRLSRPGRRCRPGRQCHPRRRRAFVLLEVLLALAILGFSVAALMRSFTQSLASARLQEIQTQAIFLGQQLLQELEVNRPDEGVSEAGFGDDYKYYSYRVTLKRVEPKYRHIKKNNQIEQYYGMREMEVEILYKDETHPPFTPLTIHSALSGIEKFSKPTKQSYEMYD